MSDTALFEVLDELVDDCRDSYGDWDDVLARARINRLPDSGSSSPPPSRRPRLVTRRRVLAAALLAAVLAVLFATPAFGILSDLIGRHDVPFTGKTAPLEIKRQFFDLSLAAPAGMAPDAIASQVRRVAVFHVGGQTDALYVAPTQQGGFCVQFSQGFGTCQTTRTPPRRQSLPGEIDPWLLGVAWEQGAIHSRPYRRSIVGGYTTATAAATIAIVYADHRETPIPFVYVSKPIDAGFFLYGIPVGHATRATAAVAVVVRDKQGHVLARELVPPAVRRAAKPTPPRVAPPIQPPPPLPKPTAPLQHGSADGVSVTVGRNRVAVFDTAGATANVRPLLQGASLGCLRFMRYHQTQPAEFLYEAQTIHNNTIRLDGVPTPYDGCEIEGTYGHVWPDRFHGHALVEIPLTPRGARFFADRAAARDLALFLRSHAMTQLRRLTGTALATALSKRYGNQIMPLTNTASTPPGKIGYRTSGETTLYVERSTTGRLFRVAVRAGRIIAQNVKPLAFIH